jgi:ribonuclease HI
MPKLTQCETVTEIELPTSVGVAKGARWDKKQIENAIRRIQSGSFIPLAKDTPVTLFVDGMCHNPGTMAIVLFARQGNQTLFTHSMAAGHGTCNEAEYLAVKAGLDVMQGLYPNPTVPIRVCSDSQLVTKQFSGAWRSLHRMRAYCRFLRNLQKTYPFELSRVPCTKNEALSEKVLTECVLQLSSQLQSN